MIGGGRASVRSIQVAIATWDAENQIEAQDRGGAKDYYHTWKGLLGLLSSWGRSASLPKRRPARVPDMRRCTVRWLLLHQQTVTESILGPPLIGRRPVLTQLPIIRVLWHVG